MHAERANKQNMVMSNELGVTNTVVEIGSQEWPEKEKEHEAVLEEVDLDQIAREAADPNSIKESLDTGIRKIFQDKTKLQPQKKR